MHGIDVEGVVGLDRWKYFEVDDGLLWKWRAHHRLELVVKKRAWIVRMKFHYQRCLLVESGTGEGWSFSSVSCYVTVNQESVASVWMDDHEFVVVVAAVVGCGGAVDRKAVPGIALGDP